MVFNSVFVRNTVDHLEISMEVLGTIDHPHDPHDHPHDPRGHPHDFHSFQHGTRGQCSTLRLCWWGKGPSDKISFVSEHQAWQIY